MPSAHPAADARAISGARCVVFAYHEMGYACMEALLDIGAPVAALFTHPDAPGEEIWWRSCMDLAAARQIPIHTPEKIGDREIGLVRGYQPSIIYSFYYRNLLPETVLSLAPRGAYNLHGSLLPRYRGRAPVNWMIINGETEGGVTLHHMVARADAGDIVAQQRTEISDDDTALTLYRKIVPLGVELIREYHPLITIGRAPRNPQNLAEGSYYGRRRPEDGRIDWSWPARRIHNLVRGVTHPYPGAFFFMDGRKVMIWETRVASDSDRRAAPGQIIGMNEDGGVLIAAGEGGVTLLRGQIEGSREQRMAAVIGELGGRNIRVE